MALIRKKHWSCLRRFTVGLLKSFKKPSESISEMILPQTGR